MQRLAIVTGTSRGLGAAVARALLGRGWQVWGLSRGAPPGALEVERYRHERCDLAQLELVLRWLDRALQLEELAEVERVGLVNNAAELGRVAPLHTLGPAELERTLRVNAVAPALLSARLVARFASVPLRIVDVSSGAATSAYPGWGAYCASKAALAMLGSVLATEVAEVPALRGRDVAVVSYAPNVLATQMQAEVRASDPAAFPRRARFEALLADGQLVAPEGPAAEIADLLEADGLPPHSARRYRP